MPTPTRPVSSILVGQRHRRDMGDLSGLPPAWTTRACCSPSSSGPMTGSLLASAGCTQRDYSAGKDCRSHVVDIDKIVRGEFAENAHRKDFTPSEIDRHPARDVAAGKSSGEAAHERRRQGRESFATFRKASDKIGAFAGVSGRTVEKIAAVVDAAKAEPEKFGKLLEAYGPHGEGKRRL